MSYALPVLRHVLFVGGIILAVGAGAKLSPIGLDRLNGELSPQPGDDATVPAAEARSEAASRGTMRAGEWPDSWPLFIVGASAALVGVVLWRAELATEKRERLKRLQSGSDAETQHADVLRLVPPLVSAVEQLCKESHDLNEDTLKERVDKVLVDYLLTIADHRQDILHRLGMRQGSEVLIAMAYGERLLNRAWSAAADGYLEEAQACLPEALGGFQEMQRRLNAATPGNRKAVGGE